MITYENKREQSKIDHIANHGEIILEALYDYRKWFIEDSDCGCERVRRIENAIEFVESAGILSNSSNRKERRR